MDLLLNITTTVDPSAGGDASSKDILLIVASVSMAAATVILIILVKVIERCLPMSKPVTENLARKEERIAAILEKHTKKVTYAEWILAERLKHQETLSPRPEDAGLEPTDDVSRAVSALELSSKLASAPKEEEVWAADCAVCLAEFEKDESVRELPCEHIFHDACIHDWFMKAKTAACPLCRLQLHSGLSNDNLAARPNPTTDPPLVAVEPALPRPTEVV